MRSIPGVLLLCIALSAQAGIYRWVDENGEVVFGDDPPPGVNAQPVKVREPTVVPAPKLPEPRPEPPAQPHAPAEARYKRLTISSPENEGTVRQNAGNVSVSLNLSPALDSGAGHRIELILDGEPVVTGEALQLLLPNVDRGTHQLSARVVASDGKTLIESPAVTFTLHRHSVLHPKPPTLPGAGTPPGGTSGKP